MQQRFKTYISLTKPGIIIGNVITAAAGFFLASKGQVDWLLFVAAVGGIAFVIASACVINNYFDRDIDAFMERTKNRAFAKKLVNRQTAVIYSAMLAGIGFLLLIFYTNLLTSFLAFIGFLDYVVLYAIWKRRSPAGTIVGSIAGAIPPVVGYCAVTNRFDDAAILLFFVLIFWQMPHFYAIAIYRLKDYSAAKIPVLPAKRGLRATISHMLWYVVAFTFVSLLLTVFGYTGYVYFYVMLVLNGIWFWKIREGFQAKDSTVWARSVFRFSLLIITVLAVLVSLDVVGNGLQIFA